MCFPLHSIQKVHKVNYDITSTIHGKLTDNFPIQKWDIKRPHTRINHPRVPNPDYNKLKMTSVEYTQVYIGTTNITNHITVVAIAPSPENEWSEII